MSRAKKMPLLRGRNAEVMLALRAGPMTAEQLVERFGSYSTATTLVQYGLVKHSNDSFMGSAYRLTDLGREKCPSRRELYATAEQFMDAQDKHKKLWESDGRRQAAKQERAAA